MSVQIKKGPDLSELNNGDYPKLADPIMTTFEKQATPKVSVKKVKAGIQITIDDKNNLYNLLINNKLYPEKVKAKIIISKESLNNFVVEGEEINIEIELTNAKGA